MRTTSSEFHGSRFRILGFMRNPSRIFKNKTWIPKVLLQPVLELFRILAATKQSLPPSPPSKGRPAGMRTEGLVVLGPGLVRPTSQGTPSPRRASPMGLLPGLRRTFQETSQDILTSDSPHHLQTEKAVLLVGRSVTYHVHPWRWRICRSLKNRSKFLV